MAIGYWIPRSSRGMTYGCIMTKNIALGKVTGPHGVKGLVKILPYGEDPSLMGGDVFDADGAALHITLKNKSGKYMLAAVGGVNDRDAAEAITGAEIFVPRDILPDTDEGEHYIEDLKGRDVVEGGVVIGSVVSVENFGASDLLDIRLASGKRFYLPLVDDYVLEIADVITVQNHEAMILE